MRAVQLCAYKSSVLAEFQLQAWLLPSVSCREQSAARAAGQEALVSGVLMSIFHGKQ